MSWFSDFFCGGDQKSRLEDSFIEYVKGAGHFIDVALPKGETLYTRYVLGVIAVAALEGGTRRVLAETEAQLAKYFDSEHVKLFRECIEVIGKVVYEYFATERREELTRIAQFIRDHDKEEKFKNGVEVICSVLAEKIRSYECLPVR